MTGAPALQVGLPPPRDDIIPPWLRFRRQTARGALSVCDGCVYDRSGAWKIFGRSVRRASVWAATS